MQACFTLPANVHLAFCDRCMIFFDATADRYSFLSSEDAELIMPLIAIEQDGPIAGLFPPTPTPAPAEALAVAADLQAQGLLVAGLGGKRFQRWLYTQPLKELPRRIGPRSDLVAFRDVLRLLWCATAAKAMLKALTLDAIIARVGRWKREAPPCADWPRFVDQLELYKRIRPLIYRKGGNCLFDTLCMILFFKDHLSEISWKFGVRLRPFRAHAWLERDNALLDDEAATVHDYEVIMEV